MPEHARGRGKDRRVRAEDGSGRRDADQRCEQEDDATRSRHGEHRRRRRESSTGRPCTAIETAGLAPEWIEEG